MAVRVVRLFYGLCWRVFHNRADVWIAMSAVQKTSGTRHCWSCGKQFRAKRGGGYTFDIVLDPLGAELRVHKQCVENVIGDGYKLKGKS